MISFCTVVLDRADDLKETLRLNMGANQDAEFVVLDYGSTDDVLSWIGHELHRLPYGRRFAVYRLKKPRPLNIAHAKNVVHRLATGDVLVNLDADNFTGEGYSEEIEQLMRHWLDSVERVRGKPHFAIMPKDRLKKEESFFGAGGRIIVSRSAFISVGGYDESFVGYGFEDTEFLARLQNAGTTMIEIDLADSLRNIPTTDEKKSKHYAGDIVKQFHNNRDKYLQTVTHQRKSANDGEGFGDVETELVFEM